MKTNTIFKAEKSAENILIGIFFGLAIYLKVQIILFVIEFFHNNDIQMSMASLI
jgi:uncharacterized membrane protein